jgi:hypothetical protein
MVCYIKVLMGLDSIITPCFGNNVIATDPVSSIWGCCPATGSICDYNVQCAQGTFYDSGNNVNGFWYVVVPQCGLNEID